MKKLLIALMFFVAFAACGQPADVDIVYSGMIPQIVVWDEVTTDINGEPVLVDDIITYNIYYAPAPGVDDYILIGSVACAEGTVNFSSQYRGYYYIGVSSVGETAEGAVNESVIVWSNDPVAVGPTSRFAYKVTGPLFLPPPTGLQGM